MKSSGIINVEVGSRANEQSITTLPVKIFWFVNVLTPPFLGMFEDNAPSLITLFGKVKTPPGAIVKFLPEISEQTNPPFICNPPAIVFEFPPATTSNPLLQ